MFILSSISKERIWGTPRLHEYNGTSQIEKIGSVYTASGVKEITNEILNGEKQGQNLFQVVQKEPELFGLEVGDEFPLIISFTAADENLSIQVHPTDEYAQLHEHKKYGKSEAWYFIEPPLDDWIYAEQQIEDKNEIAQLVKEKNYEPVLRKYPIEKENLIYIPSGTIHALTKGSLVYEIQQSTDITYRFYDYDRKDKTGHKRALHVEEALKTLMPEQNVEKESFFLGEAVEKREFIIRHEIFEKEVKNESEIAAVLTILSGWLKIEGIKVIQGQSVILLPKETVKFEGKAEGVLATPNLYWKNSGK